MTHHDDNDDRPTLLDRTSDGRPIYITDDSPTLLDRTPDGRPIYVTGPQ